MTHCSKDWKYENLSYFPIWYFVASHMGFLGGSVIKNLSASAGDVGLTPGSGRFPGEGSGSPLRYPCLGNPMDRGAWRARVSGVTEEDTT